MSDPSLSNQETSPDRSVVASEQAQPLTPQNVQGSAMLDADIEAGGNQPEGGPVSEPIATNFSRNTGANDPKMAGVAGEMGAFSGERLTEKGAVNLHNNPDVPGQPESSSQTLPDSDQMQLPLDSETNLPS